MVVLYMFVNAQVWTHADADVGIGACPTSCAGTDKGPTRGPSRVEEAPNAGLLLERTTQHRMRRGGDAGAGDTMTMTWVVMMDLLGADPFSLT